MNDRRHRRRSKNRIVAYVAAGLVHAVIIGALLVNFTGKPKTVDASFAEKVDVVKATTVDESEIKKQQDKLKQEERDKKRREEEDRKKLEQLKQQSELEKKRIQDLQQQQKVEREKAAELEQQRKAIALKKQREDEKRKREALEEKRKKEQAAKEKQRQEEQERIKREQQEREAQQRMDQLLAEEEAFQAEQKAKERATTLLGKYTALIVEKVKRYRTVSPDFERWRTATMNVKLSPSGDVLSVRIVKSSGNVRYDRSVETAIYQASPLPIPSEAEDPAVNKLFRDLNINFDMTGM
ncbi:MAG: cell envelope integrity protein TolA [Gammaproteobacteria bacterium]|nr:cell envelope integrity protein TolA [Gammaproteobacteria bacterium]